MKSEENIVRYAMESNKKVMESNEKVMESHGI